MNRYSVLKRPLSLKEKIHCVIAIVLFLLIIGLFCFSLLICFVIGIILGWEEENKKISSLKEKFDKLNLTETLSYFQPLENYNSKYSFLIKEYSYEIY